MTRKEAIGNLDMIRIAFIDTVTVEQGMLIDETFITAIKALKQEPCPDAISRQAAIDAMYALCNTGETLKENPWRDNPHIDAITDAIENLPSVNPQLKTGHWILQPSNKEQGERDFIWWKCSECGQVIYSETEKDRREYHAFCSRCGAKMVEPQERSEKE